jgi:hypothetical protein
MVCRTIWVARSDPACSTIEAVFTVDEREATSKRIAEMADGDERVVGAAVVGSLAFTPGDRWSDVDLTFAVGDQFAVADVLADWTAQMTADFDALTLFDLPAGDTIYRVFLLPGGLQVDLSFTPASEFGSGGPKFRLLFGETHPRSPSAPPVASELFGWGVAYAREGRACIERGRPWQAEHSINAVRDHALMLACLARGLPTRYGRGYDDLPADLLAAVEGSLVQGLDRDALMEALTVAVEALLREASPIGELVIEAAPLVREWLVAD